MSSQCISGFPEFRGWDGCADYSAPFFSILAESFRSLLGRKVSLQDYRFVGFGGGYFDRVPMQNAAEDVGESRLPKNTQDQPFVGPKQPPPASLVIAAI